MNIGKESEAFIAEPLPEPIEVPEADEREEVLVPVESLVVDSDYQRELEAV